MSTIPSLADLRDVAVEAAYLAGKRTLAYFNTGIRPDIKADNTPVTIADREAERMLRTHIHARYPGHGILGEEEGDSPGVEPVRWIIDPIDGTKSFVAGVPLYGVLIGVEVQGAPSVGVIYLPALDDMVVGANGLGCTWNGRPCRVSETANLSDALILTSSIMSCVHRSDAWDRLAAQTRLQRTWGDAFGYALIATGRADIMIDPAINPWDCAPMLPILREAGGRFANWNGVETIYSADCMATNAALFAPVQAILQSEQRRSASNP